MERRHFLQGLITTVAGTSLIVQATDADVATFAVRPGDRAMLCPSSDLPENSSGTWCAIRFPDRTGVLFEIGEIEPPALRRFDVSNLAENQLLPFRHRMDRSIRITPIGPVRFS